MSFPSTEFNIHLFFTRSLKLPSMCQASIVLKGLRPQSLAMDFTTIAQGYKGK